MRGRMSIRIFIWVGHPSAQSLSHGMADAYQVAAEAEGAEIRRMHLNDMSFDPDLTYGFKQRKPLEPCLETGVKISCGPITFAGLTLTGGVQCQPR